MKKEFERNKEKEFERNKEGEKDEGMDGEIDIPVVVYYQGGSS